MEQFIAIGVILAIGLVYDFIKNKAADSRKAAKGSRSTQERAQSHFRQPSAQPAAVATAEKQKAVPTPVPRPRHTEYTPLVIEGERSTADAELPDGGRQRSAGTGAEELAARKAHFERWRRAIVDAEVISPRRF